MLDSSGYRLNVGIVIANGDGDVLWARRARQSGWQFPQGGIVDGESPEQAMYRELDEEVGLGPDDVDVWGATRGWLRYRLPEKMVRSGKQGTVCIGQKQKWFLLYLKSPDEAVKLHTNAKPEFDEWKWVTYWYPVTQIIDFKRWVYKRMLKELAPPHAERMRRLGAKPR
ncbi:MAG: RNA pyrophosphohydrolase [Gammaproteobacteria bacterium]|nr:RNA pyrophosphohydrolase [Gammaproteobacteria bacterium]MBT8151648.1 RNA pyrophosphohydrolase [Gammaproteobacteria bacterium]NNM12075.1 RNA pyrophosphohydrolase [Pseudomonadales bacterium]RZV59973.1 MAG: RNA pyrophosphohydrolase [Pseudomonadales bacterium]